MKRHNPKREASDREAKAHAAGFREGLKHAAVGLSAWVRRLGFAELALAMQVGHYEHWEKTGEILPLPKVGKRARRGKPQQLFEAS